MTTEYKQFQELCPGYDYFPSILPKVRRIIAIGDLHGDYKVTIECLKLAKVIDNNLNWIGDDTIVIQIGDQVDRCRPMEFMCDNPRATINDEASDIKILKLFTELDKKAQQSNPPGRVYSLIGNHELMNVTGNLIYVSYEGLKEFKNYKDPDGKIITNTDIESMNTIEYGKIARRFAFAPGNEYGKFLGCTRLSALIIGTNLFVHAGIMPEFLNELKITDMNYIETINASVRRWLVGKINVKYVDKIVGSFRNTIFWTRILGSIPYGVNNEYYDCQKYLKPVLQMLNVGNMIIGHTPQFYINKMGMNATCDYTLWRIDNGASGAFDGFSEVSIDKERSIQVLEILNDIEFKILRYE